MKDLLLLLLLAVALSGCQSGTVPEREQSPATPPNFLFAISDDQSFPHAGAYGCTWIQTPAFDRIAREGILFNRAYTPNAKCAPSRSCILTGRNSWELEEAAKEIKKHYVPTANPDLLGKKTLTLSGALSLTLPKDFASIRTSRGAKARHQGDGEVTLALSLEEKPKSSMAELKKAMEKSDEEGGLTVRKSQEAGVGGKKGFFHHLLEPGPESGMFEPRTSVGECNISRTKRLRGHVITVTRLYECLEQVTRIDIIVIVEIAMPPECILIARVFIEPSLEDTEHVTRCERAVSVHVASRWNAEGQVDVTFRG